MRPWKYLSAFIMQGLPPHTHSSNFPCHTQVQLRLWFPSANLTQLLDRRPSLLLEEEWAAVPAARQQLLAMFGSQGSVDDLVTRQPLLLCEDVAELVGELER